jgi:catechol 2,3-dioxygenase-like lactoylglutathione lyase family enzyme
MARLTGSSAVLLVADIDRSVEYYRDRLGFTCEVHGDPPDFLVARRDDVVVLMALCEDPERIVPNWRIVPNVWNVFIRVDDVEAIYAEFQRRGAPIDYSLYDAPSGFREFGVQDPDGHDIAIGQPIENASSARGS